MKDEYRESYRSLYRNHWWWRSRETMILSEIQRLLPPDGFGSILDVGCGDGLFLPVLKQFGRPEGQETDSGLIRPETSERWTIHTVPLDQLSLEPRFSLITMLDVLEHVEDDISFLRSAASLLSPGGVMLITVPSFQSLWTTHDDINRHFRRYRKTTLSSSVTDAGLVIERMGYFFTWLAVPKLALHFIEKVRRPASAVPTVPPKPLNRLLEIISVLEWKIAGGLAPFGSSLLAVVRNARDQALHDGE